MQAKRHELLGFVEALEECMHGKNTSNGATAPLVRTAADFFPQVYHHYIFHLKGRRLRPIRLQRQALSKMTGLTCQRLGYALLLYFIV